MDAKSCNGLEAKSTTLTPGWRTLTAVAGTGTAVAVGPAAVVTVAVTGAGTRNWTSSVGKAPSFSLHHPPGAVTFRNFDEIARCQGHLVWTSAVERHVIPWPLRGQLRTLWQL